MKNNQEMTEGFREFMENNPSITSLDQSFYGSGTARQPIIIDGEVIPLLRLTESLPFTETGNYLPNLKTAKFSNYDHLSHLLEGMEAENPETGSIYRSFEVLDICKNDEIQVPHCVQFFDKLISLR